MNINQGYKYTGSEIYNYNDVRVNPIGVSLFDSLTGFGGLDYIPYDGSEVTVFATAPGIGTNYQDLVPSLNNKVYYLVSDVLYTDQDKDLMVSLATSITVTLMSYLQDDLSENLLDDADDPLIGTTSTSTDGDTYTGTFTFSNPNDYEYLYLIWDYTNSLDGGTASYIGEASTKTIDVDLGTDIGNAGIDYVVNGSPSRFILKWNGNNVSDTGYIGLNTVANYDDLIAAGVADEDISLVYPYDGLTDNGTGSILFNKFNSNSRAILSVYSPLASVDWELTQVDPSLTSFYIDTADGTSDDVCGQIADTLYYHDGAGAIPTVGDRVYTVSDGSVLFDGNNSYHLTSATLQVVPPVSGGTFVVIDSLGVCTLYGECDCSEVAIPVIDQSDIEIVQGQPLNIKVSATNNPTSWTAVTTCNVYTLTGGTKGSIFAITQCDGVARNITINVQASVNISSTALPTLSFGDGSVTLVGADIDSVLPKGLSFNTTDGILSGTAEESCSYTLDLIATNCFGNSIQTSIDIDVITGINMTPFPIDVENPSADGTTACAITAVYSLLYHDGVNTLPVLGDNIYVDYKGIDLFMGGSLWYNVDGSTISIKICETGKICDTHTC